MAVARVSNKTTVKIIKRLLRRLRAREMQLLCANMDTEVPYWVWDAIRETNGTKAEARTLIHLLNGEVEEER